MFDFVRSHNRLLQVVLGLLIFPSFIFFGVQGYTRFMGPEATAVASVDGIDITRAEWDDAHRQAAERIRQQRPNVDPKTLDTAEARRATLDDLVHDRVLQAAVHHQKVLVSNERLQQIFATLPQFEQIRNKDGSVNKDALAMQGMTSEAFAERLRGEIAAAQVLQGVTGTGFVAPAVAGTALDALLERREVQWQLFESKAWLDKIQPSDADIQAWYDDKAHAAQFRAPEEAQIEYVVLDLSTVKAQIVVPEKDMKDYYDANIKRYTVAEERRVSHILVKVPEKASSADKDKAKAKAEALLAEVRKAPGSFAEVAKRSSEDISAAQGGDLDYVARGAMPKPFEDAAFAMKQGEISNVVATDFGFHIIQVTAMRGGSAKTFEEVKPQIEDDIRKQLALKKYAEVAETFSNMVYEQADTYQPVIDKLKLQKQTATVQRHPAPGAAGVLASERLLQTVFSADSLRAKHNSEAVETSPNTLVSARIVGYKPERAQPLADVKDKVREAVRHAQAAAAARKEGEAKLAALRKDAAETLPQSATISRSQRGQVPPQVLDAALKADVAKGPAIVPVDLGDAGFAALRVVKALPRDAADPQSEGAKAMVEQSLKDAESQAYFEALKARYKAKVNDSKLAQASDAGASSPK